MEFGGGGKSCDGVRDSTANSSDKLLRVSAFDDLDPAGPATTPRNSPLVALRSRSHFGAAADTAVVKVRGERGVQGGALRETRETGDLTAKPSRQGVEVCGDASAEVGRRAAAAGRQSATRAAQ
jgi:hypothetical protein